LVAGPLMTFPVMASNFDAWQGQSSCAPATATAQPLWVQMALKATIFPAVGRATMIGLPLASLTATALPTGILRRASRVGSDRVDALAAALEVAGLAAEDWDAAGDAGGAATADDVFACAVARVSGVPAAGGDVEAADVDAAGAVGVGAAGVDAAGGVEGMTAEGAGADGDEGAAAGEAELPHATRASAPTPIPVATSTCRRSGAGRRLWVVESVVALGPQSGGVNSLNGIGIRIETMNAAGRFDPADRASAFDGPGDPTFTADPHQAVLTFLVAEGVAGPDLVGW